MRLDLITPAVAAAAGAVAVAEVTAVQPDRTVAYLAFFTALVTLITTTYSAWMGKRTHAAVNSNFAALTKRFDDSEAEKADLRAVNTLLVKALLSKDPEDAIRAKMAVEQSVVKAAAVTAAAVAVVPK